MAKSYPDVLLELGQENPDVVALSADVSKAISSFAAAFPSRFIDVGIAEGNLIGVAAGLAHRGKIPFAHGMAPFLTMRSFEQIRTDLAYGERNVKVVSLYAGGLTMAGFGVTHHATEEVALMRVIPGMTVFIPGDAWQAEQATRAAAAIDGPVYLSVWKFDAEFGGSGRTFEVGRPEVLREGADLALMATGLTTADALGAAEILAAEGIEARVYSFHTLKPLDTGAILAAAEETGGILTTEEHTVVGGLGSAVAEVLAEAGKGIRFRRIGLPDQFARETGTRESIKRLYGMDAEGVAAAARELLV